VIRPKPDGKFFKTIFEGRTGVCCNKLRWVLVRNERL